MAASSSGALADFARRPPGFKVAVFAGILAAIGLVYWQLMLRPLQKKIKAARAHQEELSNDSTNLDGELAQIDVLLKERAELDKQLEEDRKALPTEAELPSFFDTLNRKVGDAGVEVRKWEYQKEVAVEDFYRVPIEIELTGTYEQIKRFFASLLPHEDTGAAGDLPQEKERIITIENLTLSDPQVKNSEIVLTAKFTASTFRQDETKAKPAAGAAGAPAAGAAAPKPATAPSSGGGAGSGSGAAPAGAGSGSGSAKTPGGNAGKAIKAEVDGSMQQSVDRAGSAKPDGNAKLKGGM